MTLTKNTLLSDKQEEIAQALFHAMQKVILDNFISDDTRKKNELKDTLEFLAIDSTPSGEIADREFSNRLKNTDAELRPIITEALLRRGQIYEMAGLIARDNTFKTLRDENSAIPGGAAEFIANQPSAGKAIKALNTPVFSMTFTAHPTNVISLDAIKSQRQLLRAIDKYRYSSTEKDSDAQKSLEQAMEEFVRTPAITFDEKGESKKLSVNEETQHMLNYVKNFYYDLPHVYARFDASMRKKFKEQYNPLSLTLNLPLHSWGSSGDKDGNAKVNADTTLQAILAHKAEMLTLYVDSLNKIATPSLTTIKKALVEQQQKINALRQQFDGALSAAGFLSEQQFDAFTSELRAIDANTPLPETCETALATSYHSEQNPERKAALLDMVRRVRCFGFAGAKIEYRETAVEFTRIVSELIAGYKEMTEEQRSIAITAILQDPQQLAEIQNKLQSLIARGQKKAYSKEDAAPIAYQTFKRLELAREFPRMIENQVLAECQDTSNFLETLLLQKLAAKEGKEPRLGIVPLFEEYKTLEKADIIVKAALDNPAYKAHIAALQRIHGAQTLTQQVQLAHSDNARRAGMPAARAYIYEAHQKLRALAKDAGITMQFYEGGSQSDAYRGGVRSISASINEFGLHDFTKLTFQGGDLLNFLNYTPSILRLITRNISHCADVLLNKDAEAEKPVHGAQSARFSREKENDKKESIDPVLDAQATEALKRTVTDYENSVFKNPAFNDFMQAIGYHDETAVSNISSRMRGRTDSDGKVRVEDMRTISFSETLQHAGITPTWIGARNLYTYLDQAAARDTPLDAKTLHTYYEKSPIFRDVIDRMCFGLAKTDIDGLRARIPALKTSMFLDDLEQEYRYSIRLALQARTGKNIDEAEVALGGTHSLSDLRARMIKEALPQLAETLAHKNFYMDTVSKLKKLWSPELPASNDNNIAESSNVVMLRTLLHAAGDTVHHGRFLKADDSSYAKLFEQAPNIKSAVRY